MTNPETVLRDLPPPLLDRLLQQPYDDRTPPQLCTPRPDLMVPNGATVLDWYMRSVGLFVLLQVVENDNIQIREIFLGMPPISTHHH